jgi:hypothetical protein
MVQSNHKESFKLLIEAAKSNGFLSRRAVGKESLEDIDLVIWSEEASNKVFAVALKKTLLKKSSKRRHLWGWVELNDKYGNAGWIYKKCTFIAYERKDDFVLLHKSDLRNWIQANNIARWDLPFVSNSWGASYRLYRRPNTKEAIFQIKISDAIKNCRHHFWKKQ